MKKKFSFSALLLTIPTIITPVVLTSCSASADFKDITIKTENFSDIQSYAHSQLGVKLDDTAATGISDQNGLKQLVKSTMSERGVKDINAYAYWEIVEYFADLIEAQIQDKKTVHSYFLHGFDTVGFKTDDNTNLPKNIDPTEEHHFFFTFEDKVNEQTTKYEIVGFLPETHKITKDEKEYWQLNYAMSYYDGGNELKYIHFPSFVFSRVLVPTQK